MSERIDPEYKYGGAELMQKHMDDWDQMIRDEARSIRLEGARLRRSELKADHVRRAAELRAEGLSAPVVGIRMAREEGREDRPYSERQVRKWWSAAADEKG